jgi:hypothetical protein
VGIIKNILSSSGIALIGTTLEILHKKFGGFASGGRYADAHTLDELLGMSSSFLLTFAIIFVACFVYFQLGRKRKNRMIHDYFEGQ